MSARDLAIGLLFGDGGGGQSQSELFHYFLDNSTNWNYIPINNKFKFGVSLLVGDKRLEFYNSGERHDQQRTDSNGAKSDASSYRKNVIVLATAFEGNNPIYTTVCAVGEFGDSISYFEINGKNYLYVSHNHEFVPNSESFISGSFDFKFDSYGYFNHTITYPGITYTYHEKVYNHDNNVQSPVIYLESERDVVRTAGGTLHTRPPFMGTFSDMSAEEIETKYQQEIVPAIYESKGYTFRDDFWVDPPEE